MFFKFLEILMDQTNCLTCPVVLQILSRLIRLLFVSSQFDLLKLGCMDSKLRLGTPAFLVLYVPEKGFGAENKGSF